MDRCRNVLEFYVMCNRLKNVIRTGWKYWEVDSDRLESVAEHIYGVLMLAIAVYSEYQYDIDIKRVIYMLAVHELEEIVIGDLTEFDISHEEKMKLGHDAIEKVLDKILIKDEIKSLILEFDERDTKEAKFAYYCDKLECDIQCKLYDEKRLVDLKVRKDKIRRIGKQELLEDIDNNKITWSDMWLDHDRSKFIADDNFIELLDYIRENKLF